MVVRRLHCACGPQQEGIRSLIKRDIGNLAAANLDQLTRVVKHKLKQIQYRPHLVDGCLTGTKLTLDGWPTLPNQVQCLTRRC
ncbi:hypothetical protein ACFWOG_15855 [Kitasatospora sp. NPDC058406]|uniref:hypothetical protein n=1 Tax=Kitasatospora sp. NPDC058406 TaxID=3346483 RepID=UPI00364B7F60